MSLLSKDQRNLYDDIRLFFEYAVNNNFTDIPHDYNETDDGSHGRVAIRRYRTVSDIDRKEKNGKE